MLHQNTCPDTPQQNKVIERKNCILLEITLALIIESHVPVHFWPSTIATATYFTNRIPTKVLNYKTFIYTLSSHVTFPSSYSLPPHVFGYVVYVHLPKRPENK